MTADRSLLLTAFVTALLKITHAAEIFLTEPHNFSDLLNQPVSVIVDPMHVQLHNSNETFDNSTCQMSIHRDNCLSREIFSSQKIAWNTRICFKWTCPNSTEYAMRVENCWAGSPTNPIYLIDSRGCSREKVMVSNPKYERNLLTAYSVGWLTVRLVGTDKIRLSCSIKLCHICDEGCRRPPRACPEPERMFRYVFSRWNDTEELNKTCGVPLLSSTALSVFPASLILVSLLPCLQFI